MRYIPVRDLQPEDMYIGMSLLCPSGHTGRVIRNEGRLGSHIVNECVDTHDDDTYWFITDHDGMKHADYMHLSHVKAIVY